MGQNARVRSLRAQARAGRIVITEGLTLHLHLRPRTLRRIAAPSCPRTDTGRVASQWRGTFARWFPVPEPAPVPKAAQAHARAEERRESKRRARALRGAVIVDDPADAVPA